MKVKKWLLGLITFAAMSVLCAVCAGAETYGDFEYDVLDDGTVEIIKYSGEAETVDIPSKIDGKSVTKIGDYCADLGNNIIKVIIPNSIINIEENAFSYCYDLSVIDIEQGNKNYSSSNGVLFDKNKTKLIYYPLGKKDKNYIMPNGVKSISDWAFSNAIFTSITMPDSLTEIGDYAFYRASLISAKIPDGVKTIGNGAFCHCESLTDISIPDSVASIGEDAFKETELYDKYSSENEAIVNYIDVNGWAVGIKDGYISKYTSLLTIQEETKHIADYSFKEFGINTPLTVNLPDSMISIGKGAFLNCYTLISVSIPASVQRIDDYAFGYEDYDNDYKKIDGFKIYCYPGTAGEQYAKDNGFDYELLDHTTHTVDNWTVTKAATCTTDGTKTGICSVCGKTETQTIKALGHKYSTTWTTDKAATCGAAGSKSHHCTRCSAKKDVTAIPATGKHDFNDWKTTKAATCTTTGTKTKTCSVCGKTETATIAKLTLAKIGGFKVKAKDSTSITLQWNKNGSASGYIIEAYNGKTWSQVTKIAKNSTLTYKVTKLSASKTYQYRIKAYKTEGKATAYSANSATLGVNTNPSNMSGFKVKAKSYNSITLQWNKNTSATGYELQKWDGKKWVSLTKISKNSTTTYTVKNLKASTTYKYRIRAYKTIGKATQYSAYTATLSVNTNPYNMSGFKAKSKSYNSVTLQWNKNTSTTGYELQKWDGKKWVTLTKISKNSTTTYTVKSLKASTTYKYKIRAYKTIGTTTQYSAYSATLSVNTNPTNMSGYKVKSKTATSVTLQWNKNTSATGYELQKWDGKKWVSLTKISKNSTTTYTVKSLKASTTYKYRIRAYKTIGKATQYSGYSATLSVNTNPSNMSGFKAKSTAKTSVTLQWNKNTSATGYEIQKWNGKKWVSAAKVTKNSTVTSTVKSLKANTSYKFKIRAYKTIGKTTQYSSWSGTLTVKTKK